MSDLKELARRFRMAGRALARHGMVHPYGHCSARIDADTFLVSPPRPLGMVTADEECSVASVHGPLPEGVLGEVRIHRDIYRRRPDVQGVVRSTPPKAMTLGAMRRRQRHAMVTVPISRRSHRCGTTRNCCGRTS